MQQMDWSKLLSSTKLKHNDKKSDIDLTRTPFQTDYDRIIFSENFRRLDKKTQVHPLKDNDHVHLRLPHSLEVSSVGRSLGSQVGKRLINDYGIRPFEGVSDEITPILTGQIIQAACLAHDIGNPPFGHAGEEIIQDWFRRYFRNVQSDLTEEEKDDLRHFEGNAQAFRVLTKLAMSRNNGGIDATNAVMASMMKYPWVYNPSVPKGKFCCFQSEKETLSKIAENCGLIKNDKLKDGYQRHPFAYLSEAADDICYNIMDLEDAFELQILSYQEVWKIMDMFCSLNEKYKAEDYKEETKSNISHMRAIAIGVCVTAVVDEFFKKYDDIIKGELPYSYNLAENSEVAKAMLAAKELSSTKVFTVASKTLLEISANTTITTLLDNLCAAAEELLSAGETSGHTKRLMNLMGYGAPAATDSLYQAYLKITDYVSGMTDNYAVKIAKHMNGVIS